MIAYRGHNNPVYNAIKMWMPVIRGSALHSAKYGTPTGADFTLPM